MRFVLSKVLWAFLSPGNIMVLLSLFAGFAAMAQHKNWRDFGRRLGIWVAFSMFFIAIFPVGDWALTPLENHYADEWPDHVDGIIVLGGDESPRLSEARGQPTVYDSASRYIHLAALVRQFPAAKLVFSGGSGLIMPQAKMKDAEVARQIMQIIGVPVDRMVFEDQSRNTHENAMMSASIVHPAASQNWLLVTSAWHMSRAMGTFRKAGWKVYAQPTNYMTDGSFSTSLHLNLIDHLQKMTLAFHEYAGLIAYWSMGYTDQLWP